MTSNVPWDLREDLKASSNRDRRLTGFSAISVAWPAGLVTSMLGDMLASAVVGETFVEGCRSKPKLAERFFPEGSLRRRADPKFRSREKVALVPDDGEVSLRKDSDEGKSRSRLRSMDGLRRG